MLNSYLGEDGWCSGDGCSKGCSMVSCSGAVEGDEGSDVGSVTGVGGMVVDSVGADALSDCILIDYLLVALSSRVPITQELRQLSPAKNDYGTCSTLADGTLELRATRDNLKYTITEASVRKERKQGHISVRWSLSTGSTVNDQRLKLGGEDEAAENSSKQGRNLQKDESEVFETLKQGKSSGETDISPQEKDKSVSEERGERNLRLKAVLRYSKRKSLARKKDYRRSRELQSLALRRMLKLTWRKEWMNHFRRVSNEFNSIRTSTCLLNDLTRDDLKELYRLMMLKYGDNRPERNRKGFYWGLTTISASGEIRKDEDLLSTLGGMLIEKQAQQVINLVNVERIFSVVCPTMSNRHKDWLVQEQTTLGKDFSNPLMVDSLLKTVWLSTHHIYVCEELASPQDYDLWIPPKELASQEQRLIGKGFIKSVDSWVNGLTRKETSSPLKFFNVSTLQECEVFGHAVLKIDAANILK
ncbi:hypothetical protein Tco_0800197 [Tanacetum coccineum]|uniref:Uncharacterized protein n=1 Tax=Tanacetum coccineum TaxID=301880 RepID=A0ABQ4ZSG2_9ASTR